MSKRIKLGIGVGLIILLLVAAFATSAFAQGPGGAFGRMMDGRGHSGFGGMMGGHGFGGMMGFGNAMSGTMPADCPMSDAETNPIGAQAIGFDKAVEAAQQYLNSYGNADLTLAEVMEFDNNFYAVVTEKSTGTGAFELLVNRYTAAVYPEPGPNMMWNTKYGHMAGGGMMSGGMMGRGMMSGGMMGRGMMGGGMMGGRWNQPTGAMTVTVAQARMAAQQWLDANQPGARLADDEMQFPGYYTLDFVKDGKTAGMLSVNGYTGQVWYHTWHGNFISEQEF